MASRNSLEPTAPTLCHTLPSQKSGTPLLQECRRALLGVVAWNDPGEGGFLDGEPLVDRRVETVVDGPESGGKRERRFRREVLRQSNRFIQKVRALRDAIDEVTNPFPYLIEWVNRSSLP